MSIITFPGVPLTAKSLLHSLVSLFTSAVYFPLSVQFLRSALSTHNFPAISIRLSTSRVVSAAKAAFINSCSDFTFNSPTHFTTSANLAAGP